MVRLVPGEIEFEVDNPELLPKKYVFHEVQESLNPLWGRIERALERGEVIPGIRRVPATPVVKITKVAIQSRSKSAANSAKNRRSKACLRASRRSGS